MTDEWKKETEALLQMGKLSREQVLSRLKEYRCEKCGVPAEHFSLDQFGGRLRYTFKCLCGFRYTFNPPTHDSLKDAPLK